MTTEVEGLDPDALEKVAGEADVKNPLNGHARPWARHGNSVHRAHPSNEHVATAACGAYADHIATFDPPTVRRLLAALRAQAERVRVLEGANERLSRLGRAVERERDDALARAEAAERRAGELDVIARAAWSLCDDTEGTVFTDEFGDHYRVPKLSWDRLAEAVTPLSPVDCEAFVAPNRIREVIEEGDGIWRTCSGCHESEDGHDVGHYPFSAALGCKLGGGCGECGGLGAIWDTTDYEAMWREMARAPLPATQAEES